MRTTRRHFLEIAAATGAAVMIPWRRAYGFYTSPGAPIKGLNWQGIRKYATTLRGVGPGGIPVALPDGTGAYRASHYSFDINEYTDTLHPSLGPTTLWGYSPSRALGEGAFPKRHLGGIGNHTIEATSGRVPQTLEYREKMWERCYRELMDRTRLRLAQEIVRLGGDYAHVLKEEIAPRHDDRTGEAWMYGRFDYELYRRPEGSPVGASLP